METELVTIDSTNYEMVAAAMGIEEEKASSATSASSLTRLRIWNRPIMAPTITKDEHDRLIRGEGGGEKNWQNTPQY